MPTLIRLLVFVTIIAGLGYAGLYALANFVEPQPREMTQIVPQHRFNK